MKTALASAVRAGGLYIAQRIPDPFDFAHHVLVGNVFGGQPVVGQLGHRSADQEVEIFGIHLDGDPT